MKILPNFTKYSRQLAFPFLLCSLLVSGCAQKPWGDPFAEEAGEALKNRVEQLVTAQKECTGQWDANLKVNYHTAIDDKKFEGYILVNEPSSFKFIASNPLGQPVLAITSNGKQFHVVDVLSSQYTHGSTLSYALHNGIPKEFISGKWGSWLAAKLDSSGKTEAQIHADEDPQNFWYLESEDNRIVGSYLFETSTMLMKKALVLDEKGKTLAAFSYGSFVSNGDCLQPRQITIDQLSFGASIMVELEDIQPAGNTDAADFHLTVPSHYFNRYLP